MSTPTYGVGPAAEKMNVGPNVGVVAALQADGKVKVDGDVVFDPSEDKVARVNDDDPNIDYEAAVGL